MPQDNPKTDPDGPKPTEDRSETARNEPRMAHNAKINPRRRQNTTLGVKMQFQRFLHAKTRLKHETVSKNARKPYVYYAKAAMKHDTVGKNAKSHLF